MDCDNHTFSIFLDLEETVINNWDDGLLVNSTKLRNFLKCQKATDVNVFSFAIWNSADAATFERRHLRVIEMALDCKIISWPTVEQMMLADRDLTRVHFDNISEFMGIRTKVGAFTNWCRKNNLQKAMLVDDTVPNIDIVDRDTMSVIRFVNTADLYF